MIPVFRMRVANYLKFAFSTIDIYIQMGIKIKGFKKTFLVLVRNLFALGPLNVELITSTLCSRLK